MASYITAQNVYDITGLTSSEINLSTNTFPIDNAEAELEALAGRKFTSGNSVTEYIDGGKKDILDNKRTRIITNMRPIQSITEFKTLDTTGTAITTFGTLSSGDISGGDYDTTDYWLDTSFDPLTASLSPNGQIILKTQTFPTGTRNIKIAYTYGYSAVPQLVKMATAALAGINAWVTFMGGKYDKITSYSIPEQSVTKGDIYDRGIKAITRLENEFNMAMDKIGLKSRRMGFATGDDI